jgi:hypothetical protein
MYQKKFGSKNFLNISQDFRRINFFPPNTHFFGFAAAGVLHTLGAQYSTKLGEVWPLEDSTTKADR